VRSQGSQKKQEDGRGTKANAVKEAEEQEEAQMPTRNKTKLGERGLSADCRYRE